MSEGFCRRLYGLAIGMLLLSVSVYGGTYYVDGRLGSDSNPGTVSAPFRTIMKAVRLTAPGDVVLIRAGTYYEGIALDHGGLPGSPITIRNYPGEEVIVDGSMDITNPWTLVTGTIWQTTFTRGKGTTTHYGIHDPAYVTTTPDGYFDSGYLHAYCYVDDIPDQDHWLLPVTTEGSNQRYTKTTIPRRSFTTTSPPPPQPQGFYENRTDTIYVNLADGSNPNFHRIRIPSRESYIFTAGPVGYVSIEGINFRLATSGFTRWSNAHHISIDSCVFSLTPNVTIYTITGDKFWNITNNTVRYCGDNDCIHLEADSSLVDGNIVEHALFVDRPYVGGLNILGWHNTITRNTFRNLTSGVYFELYTTLKAHATTAQFNILDRNVIADCAGGITFTGCDSNTVTNNILYNIRETGITFAWGGMGSDEQRPCVGNRILHNTLYNVRRAGIASSLAPGDSPVALGTEIRNNIIFSPAGSILMKQESGTVIEQNLTADPHFVDPSSGDFRLRSTSPAIDAGMDVGVDLDFLGTKRPQGGGVDVGAFEFPVESRSVPRTGDSREDDHERERLQETSMVPREFRLRQSYPNPFNPRTTIRYEVPITSRVVIKVYNTVGQEVTTLVDGVKEAGYHEVALSSAGNDSTSLASGLYLCQMQAGEFRETVKILLIR